MESTMCYLEGLVLERKLPEAYNYYLKVKDTLPAEVQNVIGLMLTELNLERSVLKVRNKEDERVATRKRWNNIFKAGGNHG